MNLLDAFALLVLAVLLIAALALAAVLGALPGRIARARSHPHAEAVAVGGWLGLLFGGVLWPLAMVWAYMQPSPILARMNLKEGGSDFPSSTGEDRT